MRPICIYAHRGSSASNPENTLIAFRHALAAGVDGIELDVHATAHGIPVVIHDRDAASTTDGTGYVDEMPLAWLQAFDAGEGERVPTLAQVLALVGDTVHLDIEVKGTGIAREVLDVLAAYPDARWAISSFDWETLRDARRLHPTAELWPLSERWREEAVTVAAELGSPVVALNSCVYTAESAERLQAAGLRVMVWTVNDPAEARRVRGLGAHALCTDAPERIMAALGRNGETARRRDG